MNPLLNSDRQNESSLNRTLFFLFFIISAADTTSIALGGGNFRVAWVLLPFLFVLLPYSDEEKVSLCCTLALFAAHLMSAVNSGNVITGGAFSLWILVNYFFFFRSGYILSKFMKTDIWNVFLMLGRFQVALGCLMNFLGVHERTQFTYFEPSYLAIGLVPYIFATVFWSTRKSLDYSIVGLALVTSQSANMAIGVSLAALLLLIKSGKLHVILVFSIIMIAVAFAAFFMILTNPENPNYGVASWINENGIGIDLIFEVLRRAGNRVPRIEAALEMLSENWWLGVGPGNYIALTENLDFTHITKGIEYYDPAGLPPVNVIIEAIVNSGVAGAAILVIYSIYVFFRAGISSEASEKWIISGSLLAFFLMLQIESSYLRAYVWFVFGAFLARARTNQKIKNEITV